MPTLNECGFFDSYSAVRGFSLGTLVVSMSSLEEFCSLSIFFRDSFNSVTRAVQSLLLHVLKLMSHSHLLKSFAWSRQTWLLPSETQATYKHNRSQNLVSLVCQHVDWLLLRTFITPILRYQHNSPSPKGRRQKDHLYFNNPAKFQHFRCNIRWENVSWKLKTLKTFVWYDSKNFRPPFWRRFYAVWYPYIYVNSGGKFSDSVRGAFRQFFGRPVGTTVAENFRAAFENKN